MPNFVKLDQKPFHPDTYVGPDQGDDDGQQLDALKERSMSIKLEVENTIRWRWTKDDLGQSVRCIFPPTNLHVSNIMISVDNPTAELFGGLMVLLVSSWEKSCST